MYAEDNNKKYPLKLEKLEPEYMRQMPVCGSYDSGLSISDVLYNKLLFKKNQDFKSHYCYEVNSKLNDFTMWCYSPERVHCFEWIPPKGHWPQYSKSKGLLDGKNIK